MAVLTSEGKPTGGATVAPKHDRGAQFDVSLDSVEFMTQVTECLMMKAFCVIDARICGEVQHFLGDGFEQPPASDGVTIADGLLGIDGSARITTLLQEDEASPLRDLDRLLEAISESLAGELPALGTDAAARTIGIVHETRGPGSTEPTAVGEPLTEELALRWLDIFTRHRLMLLFFFGPGQGTLELGLFDQQSPEVHRVPTGPGVMVILRPEVISRRHIAQGPDAAFALSCFLLTMRTAQRSTEPPPPPYSEVLLKWLEHREREGALSLDLMPKDRQQQALQSLPDFLQERKTCVRADACKLPGAWGSDAFFDGVLLGADVVEEIRYTRFDVNEFFDADPAQEQGEEYNTYCRHASFIDGITQFDHAFFGINAEEASRMPPSVAQGLEVAFEVVSKAGFHDRGVRWNAEVQVGLHAEENLLIGRTKCSNVFAPRGASGSWADEPNRISFALGLTGRSRLFDTDGSSSLVALLHGHMETSVETLFSLVLSSAWNLAPPSFASFCSRGLLTTAGRCFCFNEGAKGFVRAEGCAAVVLTKPPRLAAFEPAPQFAGRGLVRAVDAAQSGRGARAAGPAAVSMQVVMDGAVQSSGIQLCDVDAVECHAPGAELFDAAEARAIEKVFPRLFEDEALLLTDTKSVLGSGYAAAGLFAVLRVLAGTRRAALGANNMLKQLNSHIDTRERNLVFLTEAVRHPAQAPGYTSVNSFGGGGTYASAVVWGDLEASAHEAAALRRGELGDAAGLPPQPITFWPAGGGELEPSMQPEQGYYIIGTFNEWADPVRMEAEAPGQWSAVVVLGENRWEQFQIWLDADDRRVLHPGLVKAPRGPVVGPSEREQCFLSCWLIDGRATWARVPVEAQAGEQLWQWAEAPTRDLGEPGQRYRVRLKVAGKYRTVDWERLKDDGPAAEADSLVATASAGLKPASYYVVANWNGWSFTEMTQDAEVPGLWTSEVRLTHAEGVFAIVRNRDWTQVLYPEVDDDEGDCSTPVLGPDDMSDSRCWMLRGVPGTRFHLEFQRLGGYQSDHRKVCWQAVYRRHGES